MCVFVCPVSDIESDPFIHQYPIYFALFDQLGCKCD